MSRIWNFVVIGVMVALIAVGMLIAATRGDAAPAGSIREFLGVDLSGTEAAAVAVLTRRYGAPKSCEKTPVSTMYGWYGQAIGAEGMIFLRVHGGKVCNIAVVFVEAADSYTGKYLNLLRLLTGKYGDSVPTRKFEYPYEIGDGHEPTAISLGKATIADVWTAGDNEIILQVGKKFLVSVNYFNGIVYKRLMAATTARDSGDL